MSSGTHMVHQQRHMPSGKNKLERDFQISKHHLINQREKLDNWVILISSPTLKSCNNMYRNALINAKVLNSKSMSTSRDTYQAEKLIKTRLPNQ